MRRPSSSSMQLVRIVLAVMLASQCVSAANAPSRVFLPLIANALRAPVIDASQAWSIMAIGDSLTEGQDGAPGHYSYRGFLQKRLANAGYRYDFVGGSASGGTLQFAGLDPDHEGHASYTIGGTEMRTQTALFYTQTLTDVRMGITDNITRYLSSANPDVILLMIGINDVVVPVGDPRLGPDSETLRYGRLVQRIQALRPTAQLILATLAPTNPSSHGYDTMRIEALNATIRAVAAARADDRIWLADMATLDMTAADFADVVHLSEAGADKVAERWFQALTGAPQPGAQLASCAPLNREGWNAGAFVNSPDALRTLDDNPVTRWNSGQAQVYGQYFTLDIGVSRAVRRIRLDAGLDAPNALRAYALFTSNNAITWTETASGSLTAPIGDIVVPTTTARYFAIQPNTRLAAGSWSLAEINVCK